MPEVKHSQLPQVLVTYTARIGSLGFDDYLGKRFIVDGESSCLVKFTDIEDKLPPSDAGVILVVGVFLWLYASCLSYNGWKDNG